MLGMLGKYNKNKNKNFCLKKYVLMFSLLFVSSLYSVLHFHQNCNKKGVFLHNLKFMIFIIECIALQLRHVYILANIPCNRYVEVPYNDVILQTRIFL